MFIQLPVNFYEGDIILTSAFLPFKSVGKKRKFPDKFSDIMCMDKILAPFFSGYKTIVELAYIIVHFLMAHFSSGWTLVRQKCEKDFAFDCEKQRNSE